MAAVRGRDFRRISREGWLYLKITAAVAVAAAVIVFLCVMFCTRETVVKVVSLHWEHAVWLQQYREWEDCGLEFETDFEGNSHTVYRCHHRSTWDTIGTWKHEGSDPRATSWPPDPAVGRDQRLVHEATYEVRVKNDEGRWTHTTSNLPWAQRFEPGQLWLARVNRAGMAWPERPAGAEE